MLAESLYLLVQFSSLTQTYLAWLWEDINASLFGRLTERKLGGRRAWRCTWGRVVVVGQKSGTILN